jgi:diguanylate cyclase (GGDEF)-like protein
MNLDSQVRDSLTGLYTRAAFVDRIAEEVQRSQRYGEQFCLLLADLDHFKSVNDVFGHRRGDAALASFAERVRSALRGTDVLFRYGGEEFAFILPHTTRQDGIDLAARLLDAVRSRPLPGVPELRVTASIGLASFPEEAQTTDELFDKADGRLYAAKRCGRDRVVSADMPGPTGPSFDTGSRLIERDDALATVHRFLERVGERHRGVLVITGARGSGRSRLLQEAGKLADMRGYDVISVAARRALKGRAHGALAEALRDRRVALPVDTSEDSFSGFLSELAREPHLSGVVFTVDELPELDWESIELLRWLLAETRVPVMALAYTTGLEAAQQSFPFDASVREGVVLDGLSDAGVRTWMRNALSWEAPDHFVTWLRGQTEGLPARLEQGLLHMTRRGVLSSKQGAWALSADYYEVPLAERLRSDERIPPNNLPVALTRFVGRVDELAQVMGCLERERLLTITGPGGIGKTRLALQAAAEHMREFADGAFLVPLQALGCPDMIVGSIASCVGFAFQPSADPHAQLLEYLRDKEMLLVLDGFENLLSSSGLLTRVLETAPRLKLLVTSAEKLNLRGEVVVQLHGLGARSDGAGRDSADHSAVHLFLQCARRANPGFALTTERRRSIERICGLVDGMPLAIELAASWVSALDCPEIAQEIERNLDFLSSRLRDAPERHRSVRAVFESSWRRLSDHERLALKRLSVFRGGFSGIEAQEVAGASSHELLSLTDKSLIRRDPGGRFAAPEVLRQYAGQKLSETESESIQARDRHAAYFGTWLKARQDWLEDERKLHYLEAVQENLENIVAGWNHTVARVSLEQVDSYLSGVNSFYQTRCRFREGDQLFAEAETRIRAAPAAREPDRLLQPVLARILAGRGGFLFKMGEFDRARARLEEALSLLAAPDAQPEAAYAHNVLGHMAHREGRHGDARNHYGTALAIAREHLHKSAVATCLTNLSTFAFNTGDYAEAGRLLEEALAITEQTGDSASAADCLNNLGNLADLLGKYPEAQERYEESLDVYKRMGDLEGAATVLGNLGNIARRRGLYAESADFYQQSLRIHSQIGSVAGRGYSLGGLGDICFLRGELDRAVVLLEESLTLYASIRDKSGEAYACVGLGDVALAQGRYDEAVDLFRESIAAFERLDEPWGRARALLSLSAGELHRGGLDEAEAWIRPALAIARDIEATPLALWAIGMWARVWAARGRHAEAARLSEIVVSHPAVEAETRDRARMLLEELASRIGADALAEARGVAHESRVGDVIQELLTS